MLACLYTIGNEQLGYVMLDWTAESNSEQVTNIDYGDVSNGVCKDSPVIISVRTTPNALSHSLSLSYMPVMTGE